MAYILVPTSQKVCGPCSIVYYAKDRRRLYYLSSSNALAWLARRALSGSRQATTKAKPGKASGELDFSINNVGTVAAGVLVADAARAELNATLDVAPTNAESMGELKALRQENAWLTGIVSGKVAALAGSVFDAKLGLAATGPEIRNIVVYEQRRKKLPPPGKRDHGCHYPRTVGVT